MPERRQRMDKAVLTDLRAGRVALCASALAAAGGADEVVGGTCRLPTVCGNGPPFGPKMNASGLRQVNAPIVIVICHLQHLVTPKLASRKEFYEKKIVQVEARTHAHALTSNK